MVAIQYVSFWILLNTFGVKTLSRILIIEFRFDFAIRIVMSMIKKQFRGKPNYNIIRPIWFDFIASPITIDTSP